MPVRYFYEHEVLNAFQSAWRATNAYETPFVTQEWRAVASTIASLLNQLQDAQETAAVARSAASTDLSTVDIEILERAMISMAIELERRKKAGQ